VADDISVPGAVTSLEYAAPEAPTRRRLWLLLLLTSAIHLATSALIVMAPGNFWANGLQLPLLLTGQREWLYSVSWHDVLLVLMPLSGVVYGIVLAAVGAMAARAPRLLNVTAWAGLAYPLLFAVMLYGQWLAAGIVLGHPPRPSIDDPKFVPVSTDLHVGTEVALLAIPWAMYAAAVLNVAHAVCARPAGSCMVTRFSLMVCLWAALGAIFAWDPGRVLYWWYD
jgi:hypothetical protein